MSFRFEDCSIPTLWCGDGEMPSRGKNDESYYYKTGTLSSCVKKGYAAGMYETLKKNLSSSSLQNIKYIGETYELNFKDEGIKDIPSLVRVIRSSTSSEIRDLLEYVFTKKDGKLDERAYNSTLMFLYKNGVDSRILPSCRKIHI